MTALPAGRNARRGRTPAANGAALTRSIKGPVMLITVGVLFALQNFTPYGFAQTWPVLLVVAGLLSLLGRVVEPTPPPVEPGRAASLSTEYLAAGATYAASSTGGRLPRHFLFAEAL